MNQIEQYYNELLSIRENAICTFEDSTKNYYQDCCYLTKILKEYENELESFTSFKFNIFKYVHVNENQISDIIVDILQPNGEHGQGTVFLNNFLKIIDIKQIRNIPTIEREVLTKNTFNKYRKMDILIDYINFGIMIENKPRYNDLDNQLKNYAEDLKNRYGQDNFVMVYLSNDGHYPSSNSIPEDLLNEMKTKNQFLHITYNEKFKSWIELCINDCKSEKYKWFLKDFLHYILNNYLW